MPADGAPRRADARRNRDRLVTAAVELFVEQGTDVPLDAIARRAGVGIATLYRHFPDRHALAAAVAREAFTAVRGLAHEAATDAGPRGLRHFVDGVAELGTGVLMARLFPLLTELAPDEDLITAFDATLDAVSALVADAHARGELRADVTEDDVLLLLALLTQPLQGAAEPYVAAMTPRLVHLLFEGLQPRDDTTAPPPASPPDGDGPEAGPSRRPGP